MKSDEYVPGKTERSGDVSLRSEMSQRISESVNPAHAPRIPAPLCYGGGRTHYAFIVVLLLLAFALRVLSLSTQSVWWDEAFTWQTTSHGWENLWRLLQTGDRNPPLYFALTTVWGDVAGWSEFGLRFVSLACGLIGVAFLFALARRLFGLRAGVWTLGLAAVAPALVAYSQEARMYALFFALAAAMLYFGGCVFGIGNQPCGCHSEITTTARGGARGQKLAPTPALPRPVAARSNGTGEGVRLAPSPVEPLVFDGGGPGWGPVSEQRRECHSERSEESLARPTMQPAAREIPRRILSGAERSRRMRLGMTRQTTEQLSFLLCESALLLTHYFAMPLVAALNLLVVGCFFRKRASWPDYAHWLIGQLAAALPLIVWTFWVLAAPDSLIQAAERPPSLIEFGRQVTTLWLTGVRDLTGALAPLAAIGLIAIAAATIGAGRIDRARAGRLIAVGSSALLIGFVLTQVLTAFHPRYLLAFSVPAWVLIGAALSQVKVKWLALLLAAGLTAGGWAAALDPAYAKDDARGVAAYLKVKASANDVILIEANDYTLAYYDHGPAASHMITATTAAGVLQQLRPAIGESQRVWLAHWVISTQDQAGYWRFLLEQAGRLTAWQSWRGYEVYEYELESALVDPGLERGAASITSVDAGAITLALDWPLASVPAGSDWQRSSIALMDQTGHRLSGVDADLRAGRNYTVLPIPPGTPPLAHTVSIKFYTAQHTSEPQVLGKITVPRSTSEADPYRVLSGYRWQAPVAPIENLEAYSLAPPSPAPMGQVEIVLRWRKTGSRLDGRARLAQANRVWAELPADLIAHEYPFAEWAMGETVIDRRTLTYPPVRGALQLQIAQGDQWLDVAALTLDESQLKFDAPSMAQAQAARFGEVADLLGYDLPAASMAAGRPLNLTVYWRAINAEPITTAYTVFTQLIAPDGRLVAQDDAPPNPPTTAWAPGQIMADTHTLKVIDATYRGPATLIVGWYNSASVVRVPASTGGDFVALAAPIQVVER